MAGFARAMADEGVATLRCNFPYIEAGKRSPDRPPVAVATVRAAFDACVARADAHEPVWVGGKSFGGRMSSVAVAEGLPAAGLVFLGYPLHPPGKPERVRDEHLYGIQVPMLFLQGTKDPFATPAVLDPVLAKLPPSHPARGRGRGAFARALPEGRCAGDRSVLRAARGPVHAGRACLMPRKNRRDPAYFQPPDAAGVPVTRSDAPMWARAPGYEIRNVGGQKAYRCPGCDHEVRAGIWHLVVVPVGDAGRAPALAHRVLAQGTASPGPVSRAAFRGVVGASGYDGRMEATTSARQASADSIASS